MRSMPASRVVDPVFWQVQFAIDESMSLSSDGREEDSHLTVIQLSGRATILYLDPGRVGPPFGKATFINHVHGKGGLGSITALLIDPEEGRWVQAVPNVCPQLIADPCLIPDGSRERALHSVGTRFLGLFSHLPAF